MAQTNEQIILEQKILLGIQEEIHTFERWKALGFSVKKGEKAKAKFPIWKYGEKSVETEKNGKKEEKKRSYCFLKMSSFFTENQVEPIKPKAG